MDSDHIRSFEASDLKAVASLIHRTIDESYAGFYSISVIEYFKSFHSEDAILKRSRRGDIWVLEAGGRIVGTGASVESEIYGVFVSSGFQRKGYGRRIMNHIEEKLLNYGYSRAQLSISLPSVDFYKLMGYDVIGEVNREVDVGENLRFWKAEKQLSKVDL